MEPFAVSCIGIAGHDKEYGSCDIQFSQYLLLLEPRSRCRRRLNSHRRLRNRWRPVSCHRRLRNRWRPVSSHRQLRSRWRPVSSHRQLRSRWRPISRRRMKLTKASRPAIRESPDMWLIKKSQALLLILRGGREATRRRLVRTAARGSRANILVRGRHRLPQPNYRSV
jgi:hypothetical protein